MISGEMVAINADGPETSIKTVRTSRFSISKDEVNRSVSFLRSLCARQRRLYGFGAKKGRRKDPLATTSLFRGAQPCEPKGNTHEILGYGQGLGCDEGQGHVYQT